MKAREIGGGRCVAGKKHAVAPCWGARIPYLDCVGFSVLAAAALAEGV